MSRDLPGQKDLVRANGVIAPQYFDERTERWEYIQGDGGAMYYIDKDRSKQFFSKSEYGYPENARKGDVVLFVDTGKVYVYYSSEWWEL